MSTLSVTEIRGAVEDDARTLEDIFRGRVTHYAVFNQQTLTDNKSSNVSSFTDSSAGIFVSRTSLTGHRSAR